MLLRRILSATVGLLPRLDLPRRSLLHREHNALVHHKRGPLPESTLPDEVWTQQDQEAGHSEDQFRVDPQHRDQSALEPHVLQGNLPRFSLVVFSTSVCDIAVSTTAISLPTFLFLFSHFH